MASCSTDVAAQCDLWPTGRLRAFYTASIVICSPLSVPCILQLIWLLGWPVEIVFDQKNGWRMDLT